MVVRRRRAGSRASGGAPGPWRPPAPGVMEEVTPTDDVTRERWPRLAAAPAEARPRRDRSRLRRRVRSATAHPQRSHRGFSEPARRKGPAFQQAQRRSWCHRRQHGGHARRAGANSDGRASVTITTPNRSSPAAAPPTRRPLAWTAWWADQLGYRLPAPDRAPAAAPADKLPPEGVEPDPLNGYWRASCFGRGTPVHTREGPRPVEKVRVGDVVLAQDPATGELDFRPVVAAREDMPSAALRVTAGGEAVSAGPSSASGSRARAGSRPETLRKGTPCGPPAGRPPSSRSTTARFCPCTTSTWRAAATSSSARAGSWRTTTAWPSRSRRPSTPRGRQVIRNY